MDTDKTQTLRQKLHSSLEGAVRFGNGTATCRGCQIREWDRRATIESDICGPRNYLFQHGTLRPAARYGPVIRYRLLAASGTASDLRSCMADGSRSPLTPSRRLR